MLSSLRCVCVRRDGCVRADTAHYGVQSFGDQTTGIKTIILNPRAAGCAVARSGVLIIIARVVHPDRVRHIILKITYLTLTKNGNHHPSRRTLGQTRYHLRNLGKRKNHDSKINPAGRDTARRSPCNNYRRTRTRTAPLSDKKIRSDQNTPNSRATSHTSRINPARSNCRNRRFVCNRGQARRSRSHKSHRRNRIYCKSIPTGVEG